MHVKYCTVVVNNCIHTTEMITEPYIKLRLSSVCQASDKHWKTKPVKGMQKAPFFYENIKLYVVNYEYVNYEYVIMEDVQLF